MNENFSSFIFHYSLINKILKNINNIFLLFDEISTDRPKSRSLKNKNLLEKSLKQQKLIKTNLNVCQMR